jgi:cytochrome c-type biogenesis protein
MNVSLEEAFWVGFHGSLAPLLIPLMPLFIGYVAVAVAVYASKREAPGRLVVVGRAVVVTLSFVAGVVACFVMLGAGATRPSQLLLQARDSLLQSRAQAVLLFGLYFLALRRLLFVPLGGFIRDLVLPARLKRLLVGLYEMVAHGPYSSALRLAFAVLMGMTFSLFHAPLVGPTLAKILAIAATEETVGQGIPLLVAYALGMALPTAALALAVASLIPIRRSAHVTMTVAGAVIAATGLLVLTGHLTDLSNWLFEYWQLGFEARL